ncbi:MAG: DUF3300 domain-containing protein [Geobacter sp.]|nr:MAG: DUF3300 domain-containing protein [Geobacter sp.]
MKRSYIPLMLALLFSLSFAVTPLRAQSEPGYYTASDQYQYEEDLLYPEELDDLLAPIALYADPLIAQILPAATFVDQIHDAARYVRFYGNTPDIDYQSWDISVRAVAHYPQILYMMDREYQWTASLGQAYIEQPQDVMDSIQRLRRWAYDQGNLYSTRQQEVFFDGDMLRIVPARPQYVYVPVYDPYVVYVERFYPATPAISFGVAFTLGPWLNRDCDWRRHRVYYHGWRGSGWVRRSRPYVHDRRNIYINRRAAVISVNERVIQRDTRMYREQLRVETRRHRDERRMPPLPPGVARQPRPAVPRPAGVPTPRPRTERRREPWTGREPAAIRPGAPATTAPTTKGVTPPATKQREPLATQPRAPQTPQGQAVPQQGQPPRVQPAAPGKPSPSSATPPTGKPQPSATTGERGAERGKGEPRRRGPRPAVKPQPQAPAATPQAPAAAPHTPATPTVTAPTPVKPADRGTAPRGVRHPPAAEPAVKEPAVVPAPPTRTVVPHPAATRPAPVVKPPQPQTVKPPQPRSVEPAPKHAEPPAREVEPSRGRGREEEPRQREDR